MVGSDSTQLTHQKGGQLLPRCKNKAPKAGVLSRELKNSRDFVLLGGG